MRMCVRGCEWEQGGGHDPLHIHIFVFLLACLGDWVHERARLCVRASACVLHACVGEEDTYIHMMRRRILTYLYAQARACCMRV
jgi:hypothetical protein